MLELASKLSKTGCVVGREQTLKHSDLISLSEVKKPFKYILIRTLHPPTFFHLVFDSRLHYVKTDLLCSVGWSARDSDGFLRADPFQLFHMRFNF